MTDPTVVDIRDEDGHELGYATGPQRDGTFSLSTPSGLPLVRVASSVEDARRILAEHAARVANR